MIAFERRACGDAHAAKQGAATDSQPSSVPLIASDSLCDLFEREALLALCLVEGGEDGREAGEDGRFVDLRGGHVEWSTVKEVLGGGQGAGVDAGASARAESGKSGAEERHGERAWFIYLISGDLTGPTIYDVLALTMMDGLFQESRPFSPACPVLYSE